MSATTRLQYLVSTAGESRVAIPLEFIERVTFSVTITRLDSAKGPVMGVIDVHGALVPVFSVRRRLGYEQPALRVSDKFLLVRTDRRNFALCIDDVGAFRELDASEFTAADAVTERDLRLMGIVRLPDGLAVVLDLERFLTSAEESELDAAVERLAGE